MDGRWEEALLYQAFDGSGVRLADDPHVSLGNDLRGRFHHVDFEVVFSLSTSKGRAKVVVDKGAPIPILAVRTLATSVPTAYAATFGATAGAVAGKTTPPLAAHFDNIVVRSY